MSERRDARGRRRQLQDRPRARARRRRAAGFRARAARLAAPHRAPGLGRAARGPPRRCRRAPPGWTARIGPVAATAHLMLAGLDFPEEERRLHAAVAGSAGPERIVVGNDTFAVLRAGTDRGWGVAVTCGTGINCVGIGPDGRMSASRRWARSPATGAAAGPRGRGARRSGAVPGRARTRDSLESAVPAHFGLATPLAVAEAIHTRRSRAAPDRAGPARFRGGRPGRGRGGAARTADSRGRRLRPSSHRAPGAGRPRARGPARRRAHAGGEWTACP